VPLLCQERADRRAGLASRPDPGHPDDGRRRFRRQGRLSVSARRSGCLRGFESRASGPAGAGSGGGRRSDAQASPLHHPPAHRAGWSEPDYGPHCRHPDRRRRLRRSVDGRSAAVDVQHCRRVPYPEHRGPRPGNRDQSRAEWGIPRLWRAAGFFRDRTPFGPDRRSSGRGRAVIQGPAPGSGRRPYRDRRHVPGSGSFTGPDRFRAPPVRLSKQIRSLR